jgi:predicted metal-dependent phosphotriesterase family hydrolase
MRSITGCAVLLALTLTAGAEDKKTEETAAAKKTRDLIKKKITVEFKNTAMSSAMDEIKDEVKGLNIVFGTGVSRNKTITYKAKDKPVSDILNDICKEVGIGWIVVSDPKPKASYNGAVQLRVGNERGTEEKK